MHNNRITETKRFGIVRTKKKGKIFITIGLLMLTAALCITIYNMWDSMRAANAAQDVLSRIETGAQQMEGIPEYLLNPDMEMPTKEIDGNLYVAAIEMPSIGLKLPVISDWSYDRLKIAPCRYSGSAYKDDLVIAAHNYRQHFGRIGKLRPDDEIILTDMAGNVFQYRVVSLETLKPTAVEEMKSGECDLTLFTCTLGGQSRVTIRCEKQ